MIRPQLVDAVLDQVDGDESPATALADLVDEHDDWDRPGADRWAVVESSGAWWVVRRGAKRDVCLRCSSQEEALALIDARDRALKS